MLNAKNCLIKVGDTEMDYISFGSGSKTLVMLPGLGEALQSVKGTALPFAIMYRAFAKDFTVYAFGRKRNIPEDYDISDMAMDQARAMKSLGIEGACVVGISQGGMIAMELAAAHPELVSALVLGNTAAQCNETMRRTLGKWLQLVEADNYKILLYDMGGKIYTEKKRKEYAFWYPVLAIVGKPKSLKRFIIQANACLHHDASDGLKKIKCPTLVVGGDCDRVVGTEAATELAEKIKYCRLLICKGYGHSAYEEYPGFNKKIADFFNKNTK